MMDNSTEYKIPVSRPKRQRIKSNSAHSLSNQSKTKPLAHEIYHIKRIISGISDYNTRACAASLIWWDKLHDVTLPDGWKEYLDDMECHDKCKAEDVADVLERCGYSQQAARFRVSMMPNPWGPTRKLH